MNHRKQRNATTVSAAAVIGLVMATFVAGCATTSDQSAAPREERAYRTGSNLPVKDEGPSGTKTMDPSTIQRGVRGTGSPATGTGG